MKHNRWTRTETAIRDVGRCSPRDDRTVDDCITDDRFNRARESIFDPTVFGYAYRTIIAYISRVPSVKRKRYI